VEADTPVAEEAAEEAAAVEEVPDVADANQDGLT
jgi:hypothetical protein